MGKPNKIASKVESGKIGKTSEQESCEKNFWLVKSEPDVYSIDVFAKDKTTLWDCVRNYQARNFLREMQVGDSVLFYHSNADPGGIVGLATVKTLAKAEAIQFDPSSEYYDPKATPEKPRWFAPELKFASKFKRNLSLKELRGVKSLQKMELLRQGSRLSVQKISPSEFETILGLLD